MAAASASSPTHLPPPIPIVETYSLITDSENGSSVLPSSYSAFVVRLTDASLKALNQAVADARLKKKDVRTLGYVDLGNRGNSSEGTLCFGGNSSIVHRFSLTDAQRDLGPKGHLEAIEQIAAGSNKKNSCGLMKSLGPVNHRLQISATTEDTFESTKQKTQQANEEMRRTAAKVVLKGPAVGGGMKVWHKINKAQASTSQRPLTPLFNQHQKSSSSVSSSKSATSSPGSNGSVGDVSKRPLRHRILYRLIVNPMTSADLLNKLSNEGLSESDRLIFEKTLNDVAQPVRSADSSSSAGDSAVFDVKRSCYSEMRSDDWPYYNTWERQTCRKKLVLVKSTTSQHHSGSHANGASNADTNDCTQRVNGKVSYRPPPKKPANHGSPPVLLPTTSPPEISTSSTSISGNGSSHHTLDNGTQRASAKVSFRPPVKKPVAHSPANNGFDGGLLGMHGKSPPIAAAMLTSPPQLSPATTSPTPASSMTSPSPKKKRKGTTLDGETGSTAPALSAEPSAPINGSNGHGFEYDGDLKRKRRQEHQRQALNISSSNGVHKENPKELSQLSDINGDDFDHYQNVYPAISTTDDRRRYKEDFDREYPAYLKLYDKLRLVAAEFEKLGERLKRTAKETAEYKNIEKEIFVKYTQFQQDADMRRSRREHERLRRKLGIIKDRVKDYDDRQLVLPVLRGINDW